MHTRLDGEALQRARSTKGLTHHQLARLVHADAGERIRDFERGAKEPNPRMIVALAGALEVDPLRLLFLPNGADLEALRLVSGRSAADLAQSAHVRLRAYVNWENGHELPLEDPRILAALAREMGVSTAQIVTALQRRAEPSVGDAIG